MLAKILRLTILVVMALLAWYVPSGLSFQALGAEKQAPPAPTPAAENGAPAVLNGQNGVPEAAPAYPPGAFNYYVHPGQAGQVGAQLYISPRPTPPLVGHTYITYPPLMPHEFLYQHHRVYQTYNPGSGWTRTRVLWH